MTMAWPPPQILELSPEQTDVHWVEGIETETLSSQ
jgi:hypothetical protein